MKHKVLLLSKSPSTSIGLRSYLTNIFGPYIDLEACLTDIVTREFFAGGGGRISARCLPRGLPRCGAVSGGSDPLYTVRSGV